MPLLGWFMSLVTGPFLGKVMDFFQARANVELQKYTTGVQADTQVILAQVNAQIEAQKQVAAMALADKGWWVTAWMKPSVFYPCAVHFNFIVLDSLPWFGHRIGSWGVPPLPGMYASIEELIILTCVGVVGLKSVARIFTKGK